MKILPETYLWTRKSALNFGSNPDLDSDLGIFKGIFTIVEYGNFGIFADNSGSCRQFFMLYFEVRDVSLAANHSIFGADPDHDPDQGIFSGILPLRDRVNRETFASNFVNDVYDAGAMSCFSGGMRYPRAVSAVFAASVTLTITRTQTCV